MNISTILESFDKEFPHLPTCKYWENAFEFECDCGHSKQAYFIVKSLTSLLEEMEVERKNVLCKKEDNCNDCQRNEHQNKIIDQYNEIKKGLME